jgi:hypothetical protein
VLQETTDGRRTAHQTALIEEELLTFKLEGTTPT